MRSELVSLIKRALRVLISSIYPNKCVCCGDIIEDNEYLCSECHSQINDFIIENPCLKDGLSKSECECKYKVFHFEAITTVYKNDGLPKKALYDYKINRKMHYVDFFAQKMALSVISNFHGVSFDYIVSVPTSYSSYLKRGFDHSGVLCERIARLLKIRRLRNRLRTKPFRKKQHYSRYADRLKNVRGKYYYSGRKIKGNVLLVDDIKTTGATLDECAKELLFGGADKVYAVTALVSAKKKS